MRSLLLLILSMTPLLASDGLEKHLWEHRLVLIFANGDYAQAFAKQASEIEDRDLVYYHFRDEEVVTNGDQLTQKEAQKVRTTFQGKGAVILIGKDGTVKKTSQTLDLKELFSLIDTMPMRRREMLQMERY